MSEFPWPKGTLVLAKTSNGISLRSSCDGHIWRLETDAKPVDYGCGFVQAASCLICGGGVTPMLDADFFATRVDSHEFTGAMAFAGCIGEVQATIQWYEEVLAKLNKLYLGEEVPMVTLRDFG